MAKISRHVTRSGKLITTFTGEEMRRVLISKGEHDLLNDMQCRTPSCSCIDWDVTDIQDCCFATRRDKNGSGGLYLLHARCAELSRDEFEVVRFRQPKFLDNLIEALCNWKAPKRERRAKGRKQRSYRTPFGTHQQEGVLV